MKTFKKQKRMLAAGLAGIMALSMGYTGNMGITEAKYVSGTAPFINTWLVAGPSQTTIYGDESGMKRPVDGNWAKTASASATSSWSRIYADDGEHIYSGPGYAVDGILTTMWATVPDDGVENKQLALEWKKDIQVKRIEMAGTISKVSDSVSPDNVNVVLYDRSGAELASADLKDLQDTSQDAVVYEFEQAVEGVARMVITPSDAETDKHMALSEVRVFDGIESGGDEGTPPENAEELTEFTVEVSSTCTSKRGQYDDGKQDAKELAFDDNLETAWMSATHQMVTWDDNVSLTVTLDKSSLISQINLTAHEDSGTKKFNTVYQLLNSKKEVLREGLVECNGTIDDQKEIKFGSGIENVKYIEFSIEPKSGGENHLGFREIDLIGVENEGEDEEVKAIDVTPRIGEEFGDTGASWQYFDDRIFNRTYDDYNDLFGYFKVKQGVNTMGQYVYAHTYVYSPEDREAELQFASPGTCKVFLNDTVISIKEEKSSENLNKDDTKAEVSLKQGWNKLLFEMRHEDDDYILGLYARLCEPSTGNELEGLEYSVMGGEVEVNSLSIVTQGLAIDREAFEERNKDILDQNTYPENELPYGYTEWPYVWNEAVINKGDSCTTQASHFQFQAAGGTPGYTWSLAEGTLPEGLTLNEDGTIDGVLTEETGEYPITVQVTDADGNTAEKETKLIVKERPNKWFEEGRMSALTHCVGSYNFEIDPNYSYDTWAERAKDAGMNLLSIEAAFETYYWPAPSWEAAKHLVDEKNLEEVDGKIQPKDGLTDAVEAIKRHGMKPGFYYGFSHGLPGANSLAAKDMEDLIVRYDPYYFFLDTNVNLSKNPDIRWSIIHSYNDHILVQHNDRSYAGDNDLGIYEAGEYFRMPYTSGGYWENNMKDQTYKYSVEEIWRHPVIKDFDAWSQYHGNAMRDDWRMFAKTIVGDIGHGFVTNYDQMIINERGEKYPQNIKNDTAESHLSLYPLMNQEMMSIRNGFNKWVQNEDGSDLRESLYGTYPYTFDYEKQSGWHDDPELAFKYGEGPEWGYVVSRDQFVYMHMIENKISGKSKTGYTGQDTVKAGPFDYKVTIVEWMNEAKELEFEETTGDVKGKYYYNIKMDCVTADPIDTVIKITTADPEREFELTSVKLYSSQQEDSQNELQLRAESYLNDYPNVLAEADLTYTSSDDSVASVNGDGLVTAGNDGNAEITVSAEYEGITKTDTYPVEVKDGKIHADLSLIGAVLNVDGLEVFGKFGTERSLPITLEGRTEKGGAVDLWHADNVTWHFGTADARAQVTETDLSELMTIEDQQLVFKNSVEERTDVAVWADIEVDGQVYTTNKTFMWLSPSSELSAGIVPKASSGQDTAANVTDRIINNDDGTDSSKWTPDAEDENPSLVFDLTKTSQIDFVTVYYNNKYVRYQNAPKAVQIQVSRDGENWSEPVSGTVPENGETKYNWEDDVYSYDVGAEGRYVKVTFQGSAQGDVMDILEIQIKGWQDSTEDPDEPEETVSKTTLEYFLNKAKGYVEEGATDGLVESVKQLFADAIAEGEAVMADEDATGEEVMNAAFKLMTAIQALDFKAADKTDLEMAVELADMIDLTKYVEKGQAEFLAAKEAAQGVLNDGDALQADADTAWNALVDALEALRLKADKSTLEDLVNRVKDLDLSLYTEESVQVFRAAFAKANVVLADEALSIDDQQQVEEAAAMLQAAADGLEKRSEDGGDDGQTGSGDDGQTGSGDDSQTGSGSGDANADGKNSGDNGNAGTNGSTGDIKNGSGKDAPKTGDTGSVLPWMAVLAAAAGAGLITAGRRKTKNR